MNIVFFSTSDVFKAEEILEDESIECKIVPTPVHGKAYCGVCIETADKWAIELISDMEYEVVD